PDEIWMVTDWPSEFREGNGSNPDGGATVTPPVGVSDLLVNKILHHPQLKPYQCDMCGASYSMQKNLVSHQRKECGREASIKCPLCPMKTKRKGNLKRHMLFVHAKQLHGMQGTKRSSEGQITQKCSVIDNNSKLIDAQDWDGVELEQPVLSTGSVILKSTKASQIKDWFQCRYCGKCYSDHKRLSIHQRKDCGEGPGFECPYCSVKIRRHGNLLRHMRHFHKI
ncbi:hypothetical protein ANN_25149, partial [Periplaneta americana]